MEQLQKNIETLLAAHTGRYAVALRHLPSGAAWDLNPATLFPAASMIKVPIMYEIMRQAASGALSLTDSLTVTANARVGGAGILHELRPNTRMTIRELVTLMIILSDNTATNLLIDRIGMDAVNQTMDDLGLTATRLRRRLMDFAAAEAGRDNQTTAADQARLFEIIEQQQDGLPPPYQALMLDILKRQQVRDKLPFYLPEDIVIAHKTGTLPNAEHDGGIMYLPNGPYIICVLTADLAVNYEGLQLIATLGKLLYEYDQTRKEVFPCG